MGMFDNIIYNGEMYQSKDMECELTTYFIEDGRLLRNEWEQVDGKWKDLGKRETGCHGYLNFYRQGPEKWEEYTAKFTDGKLVEVREVVSP